MGVMLHNNTFRDLNFYIKNSFKIMYEIDLKYSCEPDFERVCTMCSVFTLAQ
jgi:hypothetical protein